MIINMTGGGGGAALNFTMVPGLTQPGTASENTIWVKTEQIGSWYFSATQPEGLQEWDVWFPTGTESDFAFNALKKNAVQVYPLSAKQMVAGTLADVTAMIYQGGKWVDWWNGELYDAGNEYSHATGGWEIKQSKFGYSLNHNTQKLETYLRLYTVNSTSACFITKNKVDISRFTVLKINANGAFRFGLTDTPTLPHDNYVSSAVTDGSTGGSLMLPTGGGEYYVWCGNYTSKTTADDFKISKIWFE